MSRSSLHTAVILIFTWFCVISTNEAANFGEDCTADANCTYGGGFCNTSDICDCDTRSGYEVDSGKCQPVPPSGLNVLGPSSLVYGDTATYNGTYSSVLAVTSIKWQKIVNGSPKDINISSSDGKYSGSTDTGQNPRLVINSVVFTDNGSYQMVVSNEAGSKTSNQVTLSVTGAIPTVVLSPPNSAVWGQSAVFRAQVTSTPKATGYTWQRYVNGGTVNITSSSTKYTLGGRITDGSFSLTLTVNNLRFTDEVLYKLVVTNAVGPQTSNGVTLDVTGAIPTVVLSPPNSAVWGQSAVFTAQVTSTPKATGYTWQRYVNGGTVNITSSSKYNLGGSITDGIFSLTLTVNNLSFTDEVLYKLVVTNSLGPQTSNGVTLDVTGGALTVTTGPNVIGRFGGSATIGCTVQGPEPNKIQWKRTINSVPGDITITGPKYSGGSLQTPALTINNLKDNDEGEYQCTASNPGGTYSSPNKATVTLYGRFNESCDTPKPCDSSKHLTCSDGKCVCQSDYYHRDKVCYLRSRLAPTVTNINSTVSQFSVSWNHTSTDYDLVTSYTVSWRVSDGSSPAQNQSVGRTITSFTVNSGLVSGQLYTVTVTSVVGLTSPTGTIHVLSQERKVRLDPLPPGSILRNESSFAHNNVTLKWTHPANTFVTKYEVKIADTIQFTVNDNPSLQFTLKSFTPGRYYDVSIVTISGTLSESTGVKRSTAYTEMIRIIPIKPYPPINVSCPQQPKDISLEISWTPPTRPNGQIVMYRIALDPGHRTIDTPNNATSYNVVGLSPERPYTFTVRTINDAVETEKVSDPSGTISCSTKAGVSSPPTSLSVDEVHSRGFQINFEKPDNVSGQLAAYKILIMKGSACVQQIIIAGNCSQCMSTKDCPAPLNYTVPNITQPVMYSATDLNPYTHYIVKVAAVNGEGEGHFSNATVKTEEETPQKPREITANSIQATTLTLSWKVADPSPGNTTYTVDVYEGTDDTGTSFILKQPQLNTYGFNKQSVSIDKLEEYWPYKFKVDAATIKGNTTSDLSNVFRTEQAAPGQVENFDVKMIDGDYRMAYVYWSIPSLRNRNGVLQSYYFTNNHTGMNKPEEIPVSLSPSSVERNFTVEPEKVYFVEVYVKNNESTQSQPVTRIYPAPAGPPPIDNNIELITTAPGEHKPSERTITVEVNIDFFKNDLNGKQVFFGIAVCEESKCDSTSLGTSTRKNEWEGLPSWHDASKFGFPLYRVTNDTYMNDIRNGASRRKRSTSSDFTIGIDTTCPSLVSSVYCNGPLNPGQSYKVIIFACTNGGCTQSKANGPYYTIVVKIEEPTNLGLIVGTIVGVVVVLVIVVVVLFFLRKRNRLGKPSKYTEKIETVVDIEDPVPKNIPRKRPIRLKELADKVAEKHKDSNLYFAREYEDLKTLSAKHPTETSETDSNKLKNRYVNILPFDQTRVKLQLTEDDDPSTDFINANYLPGHKSEREYIATQGPIPGTIDDFWRMIWEQNVSIIVMLTLCKEEGRVKCEMYWPENVKEPKQYGDLVVETVSCSTVNFYDFRIFKIKLGDTTRTLKHFHFLQWKDFSANVQNDVMIDFIKTVRNHIRPPDMNGPVVVHCSAGVGRTGTYCALDHLFQVIDEHDLEHSIDIFDLVLNLREHRMFMVQTEQQYVFIHDCVRDYVERKKKEMQGDLLYENVNRAFVADDPAEESLYQNYSNQRTDL